MIINCHVSCQPHCKNVLWEKSLFLATGHPPPGKLETEEYINTPYARELGKVSRMSNAARLHRVLSKHWQEAEKGLLKSVTCRVEDEPLSIRTEGRALQEEGLACDSICKGRREEQDVSYHTRPVPLLSQLDVHIVRHWLGRQQLTRRQVSALGLGNITTGVYRGVNSGRPKLHHHQVRLRASGSLRSTTPVHLPPLALRFTLFSKGPNLTTSKHERVILPLPPFGPVDKTSVKTLKNKQTDRQNHNNLLSDEKVSHKHYQSGLPCCGADSSSLKPTDQGSSLTSCRCASSHPPSLTQPKLPVSPHS